MDNLDKTAMVLSREFALHGPITLDIIKNTDNEGGCVYGSSYVTCLMMYVCAVDGSGILTPSQFERMRDENMRNYSLAYKN